jgi:hypothetical protein
MAALALWIGTAALAPADEPAVANTVRLQLKITGLPASGCLLKVAPAHPGCQFPAIERKITAVPGSGGMVSLPALVIPATTTSADRDCTFAITIQEPGRPPRTFRRGVRLAPAEPGKPTPVKDLRVYLSAPSLAVREDTGRLRR